MVINNTHGLVNMPPKLVMFRDICREAAKKNNKSAIFIAKIALVAAQIDLGLDEKNLDKIKKVALKLLNKNYKIYATSAGY